MAIVLEARIVATGTGDAGDPCGPSAIDVRADGHVWVLCELTGRVRLLDATSRAAAFEGPVLATPPLSAAARRGRELFRDAGCTGCHVERFVTGVSDDLTELSRQTIRPFTDLLLHDMGEGLADHRPEFLASGNEWRTPPLWGIGRVQDVNGHTYFLHDGRARGFEEAILWHGGEAEEARELFRTMPSDGRAALVRFLESL